jgi:hypothetical protein
MVVLIVRCDQFTSKVSGQAPRIYSGMQDDLYPPAKLVRALMLANGVHAPQDKTPQHRHKMPLGSSHLW